MKSRLSAVYKKILSFLELQKNAVLLSTLIIILIALSLIIWKVPSWQVAQHGINDSVTIAELENKYRATLAQIVGGFAIIIGLFATWKRISVMEENVEVAREGQITERFTRAIDQLGNENTEIKLGGIYALERIANE
ncbi:MAG: hypothetical protein M0Q94_16125, partial [Candidatus Cloacimonetes bacterium]|nr:hypothetical protein [Candidatus Cloacimonadota bacterium]